MASIDRTAYPRFKRVVSARELSEAFTPTMGEIAWARDRTQAEQYLLVLVVWLKTYQRLGYFPKLAEVPDVVVEHVRGLLGVGEEVWFGQHESARTAKWHRQRVREYMGVAYEPARVRQVAEQAIRKAVQTKDNPADLINVALDELVRQRCELPGYSTLDAMVVSIRTEVNTEFFSGVASRLSLADRARLQQRLLVVDPATRRSGFDRLKEPAKAATLGKFKARLVALQELDDLGATEVWLQGVPPGKIAHFAGEARVTDIADLRKVSEAKRLTLIASLIHVCRTTARDEVATMFCRRMANLHKKAREQLEELREAHRAESERLLGVFGDVLSVVREAALPAEPGSDDAAKIHGSDSGATDETREVAERAGQWVLKTLAQAGGIEALSTAHEAISAHHGDNYLPLLERHYRSHRAALFALVDAVQLEATSAERSVLDAVAFLRANQHRRGDYLDDRVVVEGEGQSTTLSVDIEAFASQQWRTILRDKHKPERLVRRHLEVCVFSYLAAELRSGDIAVAGSDSYANLHEQLMSWSECEPLAESFCAQAGIPAEASALTGFYRQKLAATAAAVDAGYPSNTDLVLEHGRPVLKRRKGTDRRPSALALETAVHERLPERGLLDILTRTAHLIGWHRHFGPASGSDPKIRDALGRYVLMVFAHGTLLRG